MFKRNPGRFTEKIILRKPEANVRDELGGLMPAEYKDVCTLFAMMESKSQSRSQIIPGFVTENTRYFVIRDISKLYPGLNTEWQLVYNDYVFKINQIELIKESRPFFLQLVATCANPGGFIL